MEPRKLAAIGVTGALLLAYNLTQPGIQALRTNQEVYPGTTNRTKAYAPSLAWLDRLARASSEDQVSVDPKTGELRNIGGNVKLDFSVMSSLMVAGLASGFKSQVANLLWMKSDEYWHQGLFTRQVPLMEAVVTLDPQFLEAWSTAGWHWAYNIYADIPTNPEYKKKGEKYIRRLQENAVQTGLDYLKRGSEMNPDTYRLWFERGWTRAEKAGIYDEETLNLYKTARAKKDARHMEQTSRGPDGQMVTKIVEGLDVLGRTIGHLYERIPEFQKAQDHYSWDLMGLDPNDAEDRRKRALLDKAGQFWREYGTNYSVLRQVYENGDSTIRNRIRALEPRIDELIAADKMRHEIARQPGKDQPVGAYVSIEARYMPAWRLWKSGRLQEAINNIIAVMKADPRSTLPKLPVLAKVLELRGDSPGEIQKALEEARRVERESTQDLGLHFLARLYEAGAQQAKDKNPRLFQQFNKLAYETWYRSRERDALDFYALRNTRYYEDTYGFTAPKEIIEAIKKSREKGVPDAAPKAPPTIAGYVG